MSTIISPGIHIHTDYTPMNTCNYTITTSNDFQVAQGSEPYMGSNNSRKWQQKIEYLTMLTWMKDLL